MPLRPEHADPWLRSARSADLEKNGLLRRRSHPTDRCTTLAELTAEDRRMYAKCCRQLESLSYRIGSDPLESLNQLLAAIDVMAAEVTDPER